MVEMIMRAAIRVLVRDGYEQLTTNRVAEEAGASVGSLYQYFASKQEIVGALLDQHIEQTMSQIRKELPQLSLLPVPQAVPRFVELMIESHRVQPELHRVFFEQLPRVGDYAKLETSLKEALVMAEAYLRAHASELEPQNHTLSAFMLVHTVESLTHAAVLSRPDYLATPEFVTEVSALILGYLQPRAASRRRLTS
jgi:AcrR family transcriptional regulator